MDGLIGIILAGALITHCINTGEDRLGVILNCDDTDRSVLHVPISEWPPQWHGPELGFAYEIDAQGRPVPTVAITLPDQPASVILRTDAEAQFKQLCKDGSDDVRLRALAAALSPMPDYPQMVMNNEPSVCNRNPKSLPIVPVRVSWEDPR